MSAQTPRWVERCLCDLRNAVIQWTPFYLLCKILGIFVWMDMADVIVIITWERLVAHILQSLTLSFTENGMQSVFILG
jgi:hypothetical protein